MTRSATPGLLIAFGFLVAGLAFAFTVGRFPIGLGDLYDVLMAKLLGRPSGASAAVENVILQVRGPRVLAASGHGVLFTTHDPNHALRAADRAYLLRGGERIVEGRVSEVLNRAQLEALYQAPVEELTDTATGTGAFLPG